MDFYKLLFTKDYGISLKFYAELEQLLVHRYLKEYKRTRMKLVLSYSLSSRTFSVNCLKVCVCVHPYVQISVYEYGSVGMCKAVISSHPFRYQVFNVQIKSNKPSISYNFQHLMPSSFILKNLCGIFIYMLLWSFLFFCSSLFFF